LLPDPQFVNLSLSPPFIPTSVLSIFAPCSVMCRCNIFHNSHNSQLGFSVNCSLLRTWEPCTMINLLTRPEQLLSAAHCSVKDLHRLCLYMWHITTVNFYK